jgi:cobalamin biosynthesis Mg chelatase CobN
MTTWTIDQMLAERPCPKYDRARITRLWAGRDAITTRDILALDIPAADRVWAALQDRAIRQRVAERIVTRAVTTYALTCGEPAVETWARQWLSGENRTAAAARAAAEAAAWAAAEAAAWGAEAAEQDQQIADLRALMAEDGPGAA